MGREAIEWWDQAADTEERKVLTAEQLQVPGLRMMGRHQTARAIPALERHYHRDCFEFTYLTRGNLTFSVEGTAYSLSGGDLFVTFPNEIHDTGAIPLSLHQMYWFQLETDPPDRLLYLEPGTATALIQRLKALPRRMIHLDGEDGALLEKVFCAFCQGTDLGRMAGGQLLGFFLCRALEQADDPRERITPDIRRAQAYILDHIREELPLEELARVALLSVSHFKQKFKLQVGTGPRNFINYHKVEAAKELLRQGKRVTETAMELSFSSSSYFSSVFRQYTALTPTQYLEAFPGKPEENIYPGQNVPGNNNAKETIK